MTSANKKFGYYDFKHSYQYPMNGATAMEITSSGETKGEKVGEKKGSVQKPRTQDNPPWRAPRIQRKTHEKVEEGPIRQNQKILFPAVPKGETDTNPTN